MNRKTTWKTYGIVLVLMAFCLTACDSGEEEAAPSEELGAMFANLQSALTVALAAGFGKTAAPEVVRDCPQGGTVNVNSTSSGTSLNSTLAFSDCNGIDGNLTLHGTSSFTAQEFRYDLVMDGNLEERCEVTYDDFRETITTSLQGGANQASVVMNGQITARCSNGNTTCSFNNTQLNTTGDNSGLFADSCE